MPHHSFLENKKIILDFDSTIVTKEGLEELAAITLATLPPDEKDRILAEIQHTTNLGMEGKIGFQESLQQRMDQLTGKMTIDLVEQLAAELIDSISHFFLNNLEFWQNKANDIYIISGGFEEFIIPTAQSLNIPLDHVFANAFLRDENVVIGYDTQRATAQNDGKVKQLQQLHLDPEETIVVGDGSTDQKLKEAGLAKFFFAFTENIQRPGILLSHEGKTIADGSHHELGVLIRRHMSHRVPELQLTPVE